MSASPAASGIVDVQAQAAAYSTHAKLERCALVVDDTDASRMILKRLIEREKVEVVTAESGYEAVERVRREPHRFGLIVMDLVMEGGGGIEAIRQIRQLPNAVSSIICPTSSTISPALEKECRSAGASMPILKKPYSGASIREMILSVFSSSFLPLQIVGEEENSRLAGRFKELSNKHEFDFKGALERCCFDSRLLRQMIESCHQKATALFSNMQVVLRDNNTSGILMLLHNLRGEVLNLGMPVIGELIFSLEEQLTSQSKVVEQESVNKRLEHIRKKLAETSASILELPELQLQIIATPVPGGDGRGLDSGQFAALVVAMRRQEVSAFSMVSGALRILPATYPPEIEIQFRHHFEALEFPAALQLLRSADNPNLDKTENYRFDQHRILIVDDSPSTVRLLSMILQNCGAIRFSLCSEDALEIAREWLPSMVIADIHMAGLSGIELCRRLKATPLTAMTVVIVISSDNEVSNEVSALSAGAADFIEKPINPTRVVARVNAQLSQIDRTKRNGLDWMAAESQKVPLGFITCTLTGNIIEMNPSVAKLAGRPLKTCVGQPMFSLFDSSQSEVVIANLTNLANTGTPMSMEVSLVDANSAGIPVRIIGWTAPSAGGRILWLAVEDLRDWRLSERERLDMRMSSQISSLTGGIAHEFNNLLNVVIGNLELLSEGETDNSRRRRLRAAATAADRAAEISQRLGESARTGLSSTIRPSRLEAFIEELWPLIVNSAPKNVSVAKEIGLNLPSVLVDPKAFRDVMLNIVQNAYDFMPSGGLVKIKVHAEPAVRISAAEGKGATAVIEVSDKGTGMTREVADRAFDPFFTTRSPAHVGLGLTIVRSMVRSMGGDVGISSAPGHGANVKLSFPAVYPTDESSGNL